MARKKKPNIIGSDDTYTSDFSEFERVPNNKVVEQKDQPKPMPPDPGKAAPAVTSEPKEAAPKPTKNPKASRTKATPKKLQETTVVQTSPGGGTKREISLTASVKREQLPKLEALEGKGIQKNQAISLAGRRAIKRFAPQPEYIEKPEADRLPIRQGYKSTKRIDAALLDALREKHDPLKLSSDAAMIRSQFEILFWACLEEVIGELNDQY